jgi:hypothetical protein
MTTGRSSPSTSLSTWSTARDRTQHTTDACQGPGLGGVGQQDNNQLSYLEEDDIVVLLDNNPPLQEFLHLLQEGGLISLPSMPDR